MEQTSFEGIKIKWNQTSANRIVGRIEVIGGHEPYQEPDGRLVMCSRRWRYPKAEALVKNLEAAKNDRASILGPGDFGEAQVESVSPACAPDGEPCPVREVVLVKKARVTIPPVDVGPGLQDHLVMIDGVQHIAIDRIEWGSGDHGHTLEIDMFGGPWTRSNSVPAAPFDVELLNQSTMVTFKSCAWKRRSTELLRGHTITHCRLAPAEIIETDLIMTGPQLAIVEDAA